MLVNLAFKFKLTYFLELNLLISVLVLKWFIIKQLFNYDYGYNTIYVDKVKWTSPFYLSSAFKSSLNNMKSGLYQKFEMETNSQLQLNKSESTKCEVKFYSVAVVSTYDI